MTISNKKLIKRIINFPINSKLTALIHIFAPIICLMLIILKYYYKQEKRIGNINLISLTICSLLLIIMQYACITMNQIEIMCQLPVLFIFITFNIIYTLFVFTIFREKKKNWKLYDNYDKMVIGYFIIITIYFSKIGFNLIIG